MFPRLVRQLRPAILQARSLVSTAEQSTSSTKKQIIAGLALVGGAAAAALLIPRDSTAHASSDSLHAAHYPWNHKGLLESFDHAAIRRGFHVYKNVCATCHSVELLAFRNLVDVAYTEAETKAIAADYEVRDGPNEEGEMFDRPGRLSDKIPKPYPNEEAARFGNNGALPPDLSLIVKAREGGADYLFALLTGYREPPAGVSVREGSFYNPYFAGGVIGMPPPLNEGAVEYPAEFGVEANPAQAAKDVAVFLAWASEPEMDDRKKMGMKVLFTLSIAAVLALWTKRFKWNVVKHRSIQYLDPKRGPGVH